MSSHSHTGTMLVLHPVLLMDLFPPAVHQQQLGKEPSEALKYQPVDVGQAYHLDLAGMTWLHSLHMFQTSLNGDI